MQVIKRDGTEKPFNNELIFNAVKQAALRSNLSQEESSNLAATIASKLTKKFEKNEKTSVEDIQDSVEKSLMQSAYKDVARSYIEYRHDRDRIRGEKNTYAKIGIDITSGEDIYSQRENSNVPRGTVTTQLEMIKRNYSRQFVRDFILPDKYKIAHDNCDIHIHDLHDMITKLPNCILMDYPFMLNHGFQLGNKWIETPTSILTAMNILVQMVQTQSYLEYGGITLPDVDVHLGKYILGSYKTHLIEALRDLQDISKQEALEQLKYCEGVLHPENEWVNKHLSRENKIAIRKTEKETYKACKLLSYQINTLQVRGESSPFTTIGYGNALTWEGRLLVKSLLHERLDEFNRSGVQEFPKHLMAVRKGINYNKEDKNYDLFKLANKVSAITCYPDYIFPENQELHTGGSAYYMG